MTYVKKEPNEYGTGTSYHVCDTCGEEFTICPAKEPEDRGWDHCLSDKCPSYDPSRDVELLFMSNTEIAREKTVIDIKFLRRKKHG